MTVNTCVQKTLGYNVKSYDQLLACTTESV